MRKPCLRGKAALARQRGQALAFALIFLVVGALALYTAFNASQLTSAKTKLQNTADAAAYSVAVLQARDYNFAAYANRAMVANQAATAQVLSLKSWIDEVSETAQSDHAVDGEVDFFADLGEIQWNLPKQVARPVIAPLKSTIDTIAPTTVKGLDILNVSLSRAQQVYRAATLASFPAVAEEIAQANQPDTHASKGYVATLGAPKILAWTNYLSRTDPKQQVSANGGTDRFAEVVTNGDTLDSFTPSRGAVRLPFVASTAYKGCEGAGVAFMAVAEPHSGATQLRPDLGGWEALDATAADGVITCVWFVPEPVPVIIPILESVGRGGAANGPGNSYSGTSGYNNTGHIGDTLVSGAAIAAAIQYSEGPGSSLDNSSRAGLQPYYELSDPKKAVPGQADFNRAPSITLLVERDIATTHTTTRLQPRAVGVGRTQLDEAAPSNELHALASGGAYFIRPNSTGGPGGLLNAAAWRRGDNRFEYPSLFSPYWQPSLVNTSTVELEAAAAGQAAGAP